MKFFFPTGTVARFPLRIPRPAQTCSNGLAGYEASDVCCSVSCGHCGDPGGSSLDGGNDSCCTANILDSGVLCSDSGAAPCIIDEGKHSRSYLCNGRGRTSSKFHRRTIELHHKGEPDIRNPATSAEKFPNTSTGFLSPACFQHNQRNALNYCRVLGSLE